MGVAISRRVAAACAALALAATALAGCNTQEKETEASPQVQSVVVDGSLGSIPSVALPKGMSVTSREKLQAVPGYGRQLTEGSSAILTVTTFDGDGALIEGEALGVPKIVKITDEGVGTELAKSLIGEHEGSRIVLLEPVQIKSKDTTLVTVVDILPTVAEGTVSELPKGMPEVKLVNERQQASAMGEAAPPAKLVIAPMLTGQGAQVLENQHVMVTFTQTHWSSGELVDATEPHTPITLNLNGVIPGLRAGILDQRVGSRLLLVIPPDQAAGTDTLVMVVDILAAFNSDVQN
ncbi:hypothetical protein BSZ39_01920 [Bowdeniella nasicola]|uniref:peptidylprolyl isomerase n=1 Tax=Bowdeniella nasicola TaxID=208480 RepID=A0A1Q5Q4V3_9ACTO|nr:hypothetical protein [Bowdeniella nasicola]OKL54858.1 hypothetical protein BSZ39_01920 [Bowdeniella nasicola]